MRTNGTLQYCITNTVVFDENGIPVNAICQWSNDVRCSIQTVTNKSDGRYEDGRFNQYSYSIFVEDGQVPMDINRVRIVRDGVELGEFAVQGMPVPTTMGRIKITV